MSWTSPADIRSQMQRLWDKGRLLVNIADDDHALFPMRLTLRGPVSSELSERFDAVRTWIASLQQGAGRNYRVVTRELRHRVIGTNAIPDEIWIDSLDAALGLIGKRREADRFRALMAQTRECNPLLLTWLKKSALKALELADDWPRLLSIVSWLQVHPRPGIYLRQVDIPGVDSKFIESHRGVLSELLDLTLPVTAIEPASSGVGNFCRRYGFRDKPVRVRFRLLDPQHACFPTGTDQDLTVTQDTFARLDPNVSRVFITENEINFLAFPPVSDSMAIFGAGYGFEMLEEAHWLQQRSISYWGDIDTHGFAILDQLRTRFAHVESLLMDRPTLMAHRQQWGDEPQPVLRDMPRLNRLEHALYDDLRYDRLGKNIRLEQERIGYGWIEAALAGLAP